MSSCTPLDCVAQSRAPSTMRSLANAVIGAWLVMSPWILGFQNNSPALSNSLIIGMALALALWVLGTDKDWGFGRDRPAL